MLYTGEKIMNYEKEIERLITDAVERAITAIVQQFTFSDIVRNTKENLDELGIKLIETVCRAVDDTYEKERPKGIVIKNRTKQRTIMTTFGLVTLNRRLYRNNATEERFFALDRLLQLPKYSRVEMQLQADLVKKATTGSYRSATDIVGGKLSHQCVYNLVKQHQPSKDNIVVTEKTDAPQVYIEADEDHIHLQNGKSAEVKLVYVHEGRQAENGRTKLINPKYFVSLSSNAEELWLRASNYVYSRFNAHDAEVHISGDGASWIKEGLGYLPRAKYHLDKFHVVKSVTSVAGGNFNIKNEILQAVKEKDFAAIENIYYNLMRTQTKRAERKRTLESLRYIDNNFEEISLSVDNLCSAEGHVSHVLSSRMSSRPMGWSIAGAERISNLRAFLYNGGDFLTLVQRPEKEQEKDNDKRHNNIVKTKSAAVSSIPQGRLVGFDGITNGRAVLFRKLFKSNTRENF